MRVHSLSVLSLQLMIEDVRLVRLDSQKIDTD